MNTITSNNPTGVVSSGLSDSTRRLLVLLSAALIPFIFSIFLSGFFYLSGDYQVVERVSARTEFAEISYPQASDAVEVVFTAQGIVTALPEKKVAYLMVARDQGYWPKKYLGDTRGSWAVEINEAKRQGSTLRLVILALDSAGKQVIDQWYATSKQTGKYPAITEIPGSMEIAQLEVKQR